MYIHIYKRTNVLNGDMLETTNEKLEMVKCNIAAGHF